jgi:hypothetical protein
MSTINGAGSAQGDAGAAAAGGENLSGYDDDGGEGLLGAFEQELEFGEQDSAEFDRPKRARGSDADDDGEDAGDDEDLDDDQDDEAAANAADKRGKRADDGADEPDGDYVEHEGAKLAVSDLLEAHKFKTQVTQTVAEVRQQVEQRFARELEPVKQQVTQRAGELEQQLNFIKTLVPKLEEPPASMLDANSEDYNPDGYHFLMRAHRELQAAIGKAEGFVSQAQKERQAELQKQQAAFVQDNARKLIELMPELKDPAKSKAFAGDMKGYLADVGFSELEIAGVTDVRLFKVLRDAMAYRAAQKKGAPKPKEEGGRPRLVRGRDRPNPGKDSRGRNPQGKKAAIDRLAKTGRVGGSDLEAVFGDFID